MDFLRKFLLKNINTKQISLLAGALALSFSMTNAGADINTQNLGYNQVSNPVSIKEIENNSKLTKNEINDRITTSQKYKSDTIEEILQDPKERTKTKKFVEYCKKNKLTVALTVAAVACILGIAFWKFAPLAKEKFKKMTEKKEEKKEDKVVKGNKEEERTEGDATNEQNPQAKSDNKDKKKEKSGNETKSSKSENGQSNNIESQQDIDNNPNGSNPGIVGSGNSNTQARNEKTLNNNPQKLVTNTMIKKSRSGKPSTAITPTLVDGNGHTAGNGGDSDSPTPNPRVKEPVSTRQQLRKEDGNTVPPTDTNLEGNKDDTIEQENDETIPKDPASEEDEDYSDAPNEPTESEKDLTETPENEELK